MARPSYAWARHAHVGNIPVSYLNAAEKKGLAYALKLAEDDQRRARLTLLNRQAPWRPLTIRELAETHDLSPSTLSAMIRQARTALFGNLTDNAIYKRVQRGGGHPDHDRPCAQPNCSSVVPAHAPRQRHYCQTHRTPAARTQRSRERARNRTADEH